MSKSEAMIQCIGVKLINAIPMSRAEYNDLRGWVVPSDENPADPGYLVEYMDGGKANVPGFDGYVSWSPKEVFDRAYRSADRMTLSDALVMLNLRYDTSEARAERLEDANKEVSRRLVTAMETIRAVLDR